ncbi:flagellar hook-associated protein FlgK [Halochromatium roseum]|uniref:flagellar hook-associated protein FlgK n=1 Tax=Halochromatium roseum TaxID=391920 RepID=UPI001913303C|nr:flagellar hook-associated protein FlgK [Halochromatium roseum]MBK5939767.1 flagellar hook-associated protein FlgK [Halochromatium roseum]
MSLYSIGLSGLNTAQVALKTTSNNISNVYTPGHNREITRLSNNGAEAGVKVVDVERQFNLYVANQLNASLSNTRGLEAYRTEVEQINNLLADREAGLSPLMQNFFSSLEDLTASPSDPASRQGVLGTAGTMTAQFRAFDRYLEDMQQGVNNQIRDEVTQINNLTQQFAVLNREIALAQASRGSAPNGLLDQRDQLVKDLNQRMDIRLNIQDGDSYNISLPNGQQLVTGTKATKLAAMDAPNDPRRTLIGYQDGRSGGVVPLQENLITGGSLGGLMTFRNETLDKTQNQIGQLAASLVIGFNDQHRLGRDLNGDQGTDFFSIADPVVYSDDRNSGSASITNAAFDTANVSQLRATDYEVLVTDAAAPAFSVIRKDTGETLDAAEVSFADPNGDGTNAILSFGGVTLTFDDVGELAVNDSFEVQPVRHAAVGMEVLISDTDKIAAGLFADPDSGPGDNRNALALQELQNADLVAGQATLTQAYASIVSDVGNRTNIVQVNLDASLGITEQLEALQQSESGVNLDEEAANLIRFQQFYAANARVIDTASTIFDTILGLRN